jgi:hypothetical protein
LQCFPGLFEHSKELVLVVALAEPKLIVDDGPQILDDGFKSGDYEGQSMSSISLSTNHCLFICAEGEQQQVFVRHMQHTIGGNGCKRNGHSSNGNGNSSSGSSKRHAVTTQKHAALLPTNKANNKSRLSAPTLSAVMRSIEAADAHSSTSSHKQQELLFQKQLSRDRGDSGSNGNGAGAGGSKKEKKGKKAAAASAASAASSAAGGKTNKRQ